MVVGMAAHQMCVQGMPPCVTVTNAKGRQNVPYMGVRVGR